MQWNLEQAIETLSGLEVDALLDAEEVVQATHLSGQTDDLDASIEPRGYRMLSRVPRIPDDIVDLLVEHFGSLDKLTRATVSELAEVDGVGEHWARTIKSALARIAESSILDRYA
jgi:diadenylate cyclase